LSVLGRAGGILTISGSRWLILGRGLEPVDVEKHDSVWKYVFHDSDGNEIGIGGDVSTTGR
jgi:hypothetical protein